MSSTFQYHNGLSLVYGDPLVIEDELYAALGDDSAFEAAQYRPPSVEQQARETRNLGPEDLAHYRTDLAGRRQQAAAARAAIWGAVREAFHMAPFDPATGQGATAADCNAALLALWDHLAGQKKSTGDSPTSSPPSTVTPAPSPTTSTPAS